jgi:hypothetical protein
MKLRWWILGTMAALAGSMIVLKHFGDNRNEAIGNVDGDNGKNISEASSVIPESDSEEIDFLI